MRRIVLLLTVLAALSAPAALASGSFPQTIPLPNGWQPEGIAIGNGTTFYIGSIPTGAVFRGDLRTGKGAVLVQGASGRAATGIDFDRNRLFVAGASTGKAFVYDAKTAALIQEVQLATGSGATFVNDVAVTRGAAYFTDSNRAVFYKLPLASNGAPAGSPQVITLTGDFQLVSGLNLNGIEATPDGKLLLAVQTATGKLFTIDPASGATKTIDLGGVALMNGDGILLSGRTLYVVQNRDNKVAVVQLAADFSSGSVVRTITDPRLDVPTTIDRFGKRLYTVNARFGTAATPTTPYTVVQLRG